MYSSFEDSHAAARAALTASHLQACAAGRALQLPAPRRPPAGRAPPPAAPGAAGSAAVQPPRRAKKKHSARAPPSSRRSSTTVVATDVGNFRAMVQELTGFPPAAIFRPLPRRVHADNPFVAGGGQGCGGEGRGNGSGTTNTAGGGGGGGGSPDAAPAVQPVMQHQQPLYAPPEVFDGLSDLGSPEFDSWGDLCI
ncbi:hypothetical protein ACP4OV_000314 [Aristida adscensionis]